jgi:multidrug resistance efflux pump
VNQLKKTMVEQPFSQTGIREPLLEESRGTAGENSAWQEISRVETLMELAQHWLNLQSQLIGGVVSGIVVFGAPEKGPFAPVAQMPSHHRDPQVFARVTERALRERKGVVIRREVVKTGGVKSSLYQVAYPILALGQLHGVAVFELLPRAQNQMSVVMRQMRWGMAWFENWLLRRGPQAETANPGLLADALDLTAVALQEDAFQAAATAFATELATRLNCDRVSIGFVKRKRVRVAALSHSAQFGEKMNLLHAISVAMDESVDQRETILYPPENEDCDFIIYAHRELAKRQSDGAILTVPFQDTRGSVFGAITLERSINKPFTRESVQLCESVAALVGPALKSKLENDRWIMSKVAESAWRQVKKVTGAGYPGIKLSLLALAAVLLFFLIAEGEYRVTANSVIEGSVQRALVAPYAGYIEEAYARAGDVLEEGKLLCRLDDRDLRLERLAWASQREQYQRQQREAMANNDRARMKVLSEQINQVEAQIALLDERIDRARIAAPFTGVVVSGDLSQALGTPVERGEILFEMAPLESYRVILNVDEEDIDHVQVNQEGRLVLTALPEQSFPILVERITPVSTSQDGKTTFRVEATLTQNSPQLRPGMEGVGKIDIEKRKLIWIWTHDLINWLRLRFWSWLP